MTYAQLASSDWWSALKLPGFGSLRSAGALRWVISKLYCLCPCRAPRGQQRPRASAERFGFWWFLLISWLSCAPGLKLSSGVGSFRPPNEKQPDRQRDRHPSSSPIKFLTPGSLEKSSKHFFLFKQLFILMSFTTGTHQSLSPKVNTPAQIILPQIYKCQA